MMGLTEESSSSESLSVVSPAEDSVLCLMVWSCSGSGDSFLGGVGGSESEITISQKCEEFVSLLLGIQTGIPKTKD